MIFQHQRLGLFKHKNTQTTKVSSTLRMNEIASMNEWMNE
jgi:hypothetical protein